MLKVKQFSVSVWVNVYVRPRLTILPCLQPVCRFRLTCQSARRGCVRARGAPSSAAWSTIKFLSKWKRRNSKPAPPKRKVWKWSRGSVPYNVDHMTWLRYIWVSRRTHPFPGVVTCVFVCLQSRRSTAQSTARATCAAGQPVSWEQRGTVRGTSRTALTSAAWWQWDASTPTRLPSLMEKSRWNPQSSSRAMPWMANSPLLIKGRIEFQQRGWRGLHSDTARLWF